MSVFLYYFPGYGDTKSQLTREDVKRTFARESLWDVLHTSGRFAQNTIANVLVHRAPDNGRGTILTCQTGNEEIPGFLPGYYPDKQTWVKIENKGDDPCWLGWYNDDALKPNPESLQRLWPIAGEFVELGDGNQWQAPVIRTVPRRKITLPQILSLQDDDSVELETKPEFAEFQTLSDAIWDHYWGIEGKELDNAGVLSCVIKCLNLNYRVSRPEVRALKLLDSENWRQVFRASNNFDLLEELLADNEKKASQQQQSAQLPGQEVTTKPVEVSQNSTSPVSADS